jgi:membrane protease YdiL (CAAX protease family)
MDSASGTDAVFSYSDPVPEAGGRGFWTYTDLAMLLAAILPSLALAFGLLRLAQWVAPVLLKPRAVSALTAQLLWYVLMMGALHGIVLLKYGQGIARPQQGQGIFTALAWHFRVPRLGLYILAGPLMAVGLSALGVLLGATNSNEIEMLIDSKQALILMALFGVLLGPAFEEMIFRGFLLPLFAQSMRPLAAILLTAALFALPHAAQYNWAWQPVMLIGVAGAVFGWVRLRTGSTGASFTMHAAYNAIQFVAWAAQHWNTLQ